MSDYLHDPLVLKNSFLRTHFGFQLVKGSKVPTKGLWITWSTELGGGGGGGGKKEYFFSTLTHFYVNLHKNVSFSIGTHFIVTV